MRRARCASARARVQGADVHRIHHTKPKPTNRQDMNVIVHTIYGVNRRLTATRHACREIYDNLLWLQRRVYGNRCVRACVRRRPLCSVVPFFVLFVERT